jgi:hypothetical protein
MKLIIGERFGRDIKESGKGKGKGEGKDEIFNLPLPLPLSLPDSISTASGTITYDNQTGETELLENYGFIYIFYFILQEIWLFIRKIINGIKNLYL